MQVGLRTSTSTALASPLNRGVIGATSVTHAPKMNNGDFPASPVIATRPQRYSVQLNDQLTRLQQADAYLANVENATLNYRHSLNGGHTKQPDALAHDSQQLQSLLNKRSQLSGGTVDSQLNSVVQGNAQVDFGLPEVDSWLTSPPEATLLFSRDGSQKKVMTAINLPQEASSAQRLQALNHSLRRIGVRAQTGEQPGQYRYSCNESQWASVKSSLSVSINGDGKLARADKKLQMIEPQSISSQLSDLPQMDNRSAQSVLQSTLDKISSQRQSLARQQEQARSAISNMADYGNDDSASRAAEGLSSLLSGVNQHYQTLAEAVNGQANLPAATVRTLLGEQEY
ncbi:MAG: flagellar hook-associated protein [Ewingella sp.]|uniref:flagellar hook-associated protein n=1 Tax=Ewingella TaxID=41201 RepID=UPI0033656CB5